MGHSIFPCCEFLWPCLYACGLYDSLQWCCSERLGGNRYSSQRPRQPWTGSAQHEQVPQPVACLQWHSQWPDHPSTPHTQSGQDEGAEGKGGLLLTVHDEHWTVCLQAAIGQSHLTDEALEELSEAREPRQRSGRPVGRDTLQSHLPKFSTWAEGEQPQLDSVTISKHVKQMVDVSHCMHD